MNSEPHLKSKCAESYLLKCKLYRGNVIYEIKGTKVIIMLENKFWFGEHKELINDGDYFHHH